jgi:uncharacterized protein (DUF2235 family)
MKRIALFSDGTGNSAGKAQKTNVWRMFEALDQAAGDQLAMYDDGVGTSPIRLLAVLGGAFGWGLKRNVINLYKFVCRSYQEGDELYGFGFSRGAFTIRMLTGLILTEGLVSFRSEEELQRNARAAYLHYRSERFPAGRFSPVRLARWLRDGAIAWLERVLERPSYAALAKRTGIPIHFLGVWDTVSAYGMPIEEFKPAVNWLLWPMMFKDLTLNPAVRHASHALSLDDERTTFHPIVWDEHEEARMVAEGVVAPGRLRQVWFAGVHSNVGGGYPEDRLALVSLDWMMRQASDCGLRLLAPAVARVAADKSPFARLYNSRAGAGAAYRYSPRQIKVYRDGGQFAVRPVIHDSVIMRMAEGADGYAPLSLPALCWVLAADGTLLPMRGADTRLITNAAPRSAPGCVQTLDAGAAQQRVQALRTAIDTLGKPDAQAIALVLDTIWWRRLAYFASAAMSLVLVTFPLAWKPLSDALWAGLVKFDALKKFFMPLREQFTNFDNGSRSVVSGATDAVASFIPGYLASWVGALKTSPLSFLTVVILLGASVIAGNVLRTRIRDRTLFAWHADLKQAYLHWLGDYAQRSVRTAGLVAGVACVCALWAFVADASLTARWELSLAALATSAGFAWRALRLRAQRRNQLANRVEDNQSLPSSASLALARSLRSNAAAVGAYHWVGERAVPMVFAVALALGLLIIGNRIGVDAANIAGVYCRPAAGEPNKLKIGESVALAGFQTSQVCWSSRQILERNARYKLTLVDPDGRWFDRARHTDVGGFPGDEARHLLATPLKRWWRENWFTPIVRVGHLGNEEYALHPSPADSGPPCKLIADTKVGTFEPITDGEVEQAERRWAADPATRDCLAAPAQRRMSAEITAQSEGELYLYVNDAALFLPGMTDNFYRNNRGRLTLTIERLAPALAD